MATATSFFGTCLLLVVVLADAIPYRKNEGDPCGSGESRGVCRRVSSCGAAMEAFDLRRPLPPRCGFIGYEEVVCCPEAPVDGDYNGIEPVRKPWEDEEDSGKRGNGSRGDDKDDRNDGLSVRPGSAASRSTKACESYREFMNGPTYHILNGQRTNMEEFPHMAALGFRVPGEGDLSWDCGGSLISDRYVLTAAHCCSNSRRKRPVRVQLGTFNLTTAAPGDFQFGIEEIFIHPEYKVRSYHHDIALLKLDRRVEMSETMMPACLYTKSGNPAGEFTVTGWGATNTIGTRSSAVLLKTSISAVPVSECQRRYKSKFPEGFDSSVICAGDPEGKSDTCSGDSGGPLQVKLDSEMYSIVGVTSLGPTPCGGSIPSIYTRVSSHLEWIENTVWP